MELIIYVDKHVERLIWVFLLLWFDLIITVTLEFIIVYGMNYNMDLNK